MGFAHVIKVRKRPFTPGFPPLETEAKGSVAQPAPRAHRSLLSVHLRNKGAPMGSVPGDHACPPLPSSPCEAHCEGVSSARSIPALTPIPNTAGHPGNQTRPETKPPAQGSAQQHRSGAPLPAPPPAPRALNATALGLAWGPPSHCHRFRSHKSNSDDRKIKTRRGQSNKKRQVINREKNNM